MGVEPSNADGVIVTESPALPASDVPVVKLTLKFVEAPEVAVPGEVTRLPTGGVGVPIV
jgi:hypothetical protein